MTHRQQPLGSRFPPSATADDVLAGIDLAGRNVIATGGHVGIGLDVTMSRPARSGSDASGGTIPIPAALTLSERTEI